MHIVLLYVHYAQGEPSKNNQGLRVPAQERRSPKTCHTYTNTGQSERQHVFQQPHGNRFSLFTARSHLNDEDDAAHPHLSLPFRRLTPFCRPVVAKQDFPVKELGDLRKEHIPFQSLLHDVGKAIAEELCRQGAGQVR